MFNFDDEEYFGLMARIKIIGVGDFGAKMINYAIANVLLNVEFAVVATNNETLLNSSAPQRIKVSDTTDKETRENLFELIRDFDLLFVPDLSDLSNENVSKQLAELSNLDLLFIFTDLSDENISKQLAQLAELSQHILTVAIVPESAPNKEKFQNLVDSLIVVDDDNIFLMYSAVRCINNLITKQQLVGLDFADVNELLKNSGIGYVAYGNASGETAEIDAMKNAINSVKDTLSKSKRILFCIIGGIENLNMMEVNEASTIVQEAAHPDAEIIWGVIASDDVTYLDSVETIIITIRSEVD